MGYLQKYCYRPLCNGARRDTYSLPDDMETFGGSYVNILALGEFPNNEDHVETFEYAEPHLITSISEQRKNHEDWIDSVKYTPGFINHSRNAIIINYRSIVELDYSISIEYLWSK
jgi:hypothetical protein